jgi:hypothetical protein
MDPVSEYHPDEIMNHAVDSILHNWNDWSKDAIDAANIEQDQDVWYHTMRDYLTPLIRKAMENDRESCRVQLVEHRQGLLKIAGRSENASAADIRAYVAGALGMKLTDLEAWIEEANRDE